MFGINAAMHILVKETLRWISKVLFLVQVVLEDQVNTIEYLTCTTAALTFRVMYFLTIRALAFISH